jgi:hypothetical protein
VIYRLLKMYCSLTCYHGLRRADLKGMPGEIIVKAIGARDKDPRASNPTVTQ